LRSSLEWTSLERLGQLSFIESDFFATAEQLASAIERLRCDLDPQSALLYQARCHCGFAALDADRLEGLSGQAMSALRQGLDYSQRVLRSIARRLIIEGEGLDDEVLTEITHLSHGELLPEISEKTIAALNQALADAPVLGAGQAVRF